MCSRPEVPCQLRDIDLSLGCVCVTVVITTTDVALNERIDKGLELGTEELEVDVFGTGSTHANKGKVDLGLRG